MKRRFIVLASLFALALGGTFAWLSWVQTGTTSRAFVAALVGVFCGVVAAGMVALVVWFVRRWRSGPPPPLTLAPGQEPLFSQPANHLTTNDLPAGRLVG